MRRRQFVALTGSTGIAALPGCSEGSDDDPDSQATPDDDGGDDGSGSSSPEETEEPTGTPEQEAEAEREAIGYPSEYIEIHDVSWNPPEDEYSGPSVTGIADNVSGEELSYVEVQIQAFDENDTQIGEALDNVSDLRADKSWQFECNFFDVEEEDIDYWMGRAEVSNY